MILLLCKSDHVMPLLRLSKAFRKMPHLSISLLDSNPPTPMTASPSTRLPLLPTPCAPAPLASPLFFYTHQASPHLTGLCISISFHLEFSPTRLTSSSLQLHRALPHFFPVSPSGQTTTSLPTQCSSSIALTSI